MFNRGAFDRILFNRMAGDDLAFRAEMAERVQAMIGTGQNAHEVIFAGVDVRAQNSYAAGALVALPGRVDCLRSVTLVCVEEAALRGAAALGADAWGSLDSGQPVMPEAAVSGRQWLSVDSDTRMTAAAAARQGTYLSVNAPFPAAALSLVFWTEVSTRRFTYLLLEVNTPIPAGGRLVINSSDYVVTLDGANIIAKHSGDWLHLDREVYDVTITPMSGAGTLRNTVLYRELWK